MKTECEVCHGEGVIDYHGHIIECSCMAPTKNDSAPKSDEAKPDLSLLPYDLINEMLIPTYEEGLQEYYRDSWRLGFKVSRMVAALLRHLFAFVFKHEDYDPTAYEKYGIKKHHLGAIMFCAISIYNSLQINSDKFDDRPKKKDAGNGNNKKTGWRYP